MKNIFKSKGKVKLLLSLLVTVVLTLGLSLSLQSVAAAVLSTPYRGIQLGNGTYMLNATDNLIWGVSTDSSAGSFILLQKVNGATYTDKFRIDSNGNITVATSSTITTGQIKITGGTPGDGRVLTSDANGLASWKVPSGGSQWTTASPNIYYNGGNVGIGTAAPGASLHISNANPAQPMTQFTDTWVNVGSQNRIMLQGYNSFTSFNTWKILSGGAGYFRGVFVTDDGGTTNPIRLNPIGNSYFNVTGANIGIGTASPGYKLDVVGDINISAGSAYMYAGTRIISSQPGLNNYFFGGGAGNLTMTGTNNIALGDRSLTDNTAGIFNVAVGATALFRNTAGSNNVAIGPSALYFNTTGNHNSALGSVALWRNSTGVLNSAVGDNTLYSNTTGGSNSALGSFALYNNTTGSSNSALGSSAGRYITGGALPNQTSDTSVYLGTDTKARADGDSNEIVIGYNATGLGSNTVVLGNSSTVTTALRGNVGIGTSNPAYKLHVSGDINFTGNLLQNGVPVALGGAEVDTLQSVTTRGNTTDTGLVINGQNIDHQANNFFYLNSYDGLQLRINADGVGASNFQINNSANNAVFTVTNAGNVGIGTASPISPLSVVKQVGSYGTPMYVEQLGSADASYKNVAIFAGNRGSVTAADNTNIGLWQKNSTVGNYANVNFYNSQGQVAAYLGAKFVDQDAGGSQSGAFVMGTYNDGAAADRLYIAPNGNVGIGTTNPGTYKLNIAGTGYLGAAAWVYSSDKRLKENIDYFSEASGLDKIKQLKPARFDYINGEKNQLGFIAQDVQVVIPEAVSSNKSTGMLGLKTDFIIPYLVQAVKELAAGLSDLTAKVEDLFKKALGHDTKIQALEKANLEQQRQIDELKNQIEAIKNK